MNIDRLLGSEKLLLNCLIKCLIVERRVWAKTFEGRASVLPKHLAYEGVHSSIYNGLKPDLSLLASLVQLEDSALTMEETVPGRYALLTPPTCPS